MAYRSKGGVQFQSQALADQADTEDARNKTVAERTSFRNAAVKNGVAGMPSASAIKTMSDADWLTHEQRAARQNFHGVDENGKPLSAPAPTPLVDKPASGASGAYLDATGKRVEATPLDTIPDKVPGVPTGMQWTGAGLTANVGGRTVAVQPSAEQAMSHATGGKWDTMSVGERADYLRANPASTPQGTVVPGSAGNGELPQMGAAERRAVEQRYAPRAADPNYTNGVPTPVAGTVRSAADIPAGTVRSINGVPLSDGVAPTGPAAPVRSAPSNVVAPVVAGVNPSGAPVASQSSDVLSGIPSRFDPNASIDTTRQTFGGKRVDTNISNGTAAITPTPTAPQTLGQRVGATIPAVIGGAKAVAAGGLNELDKVASTAFNATGIPAAGQLLGAGVDGAKMVANAVVPAVTQFVQGVDEGRKTAAGVSNSQAAGFQQPTKDNPVPVTPTSPTPNIDRSDNSIAKFGQTDEDWKNRKLAFAGF